MVTARNTARIISTPNSVTPSCTVVRLTHVPSEVAYPDVPSPDRSNASNVMNAATSPVPTIFISLFILYTKKR